MMVFIVLLNLIQLRLIVKIVVLDEHASVGAVVCVSRRDVAINRWTYAHQRVGYSDDDCLVKGVYPKASRYTQKRVRARQT